MELLEQLYKSALFRDIAREDFLTIVSMWNGSIRSVDENSYLQRQDERAKHAGAVLAGKLSVCREYADGTLSILDILYPGKLFGLDMVFTSRKSSTASVISLTKASVFVFPLSGLESLEWVPEPHKTRMYTNMLTHLANENVRKQYKIEIVSQRGLRDRILTYLRIMARRRGSGQFDIPFTRGQLADYLCVNRSALSHELSRMQREGIIRYQLNHFTLLDTAPAHGP